MENATRYLTGDEHRLGMSDAAQFYRLHGVDNVLVAYGWGCDCPDDELYIDQPIPLSQFQQFVDAAQANDYYRVSKDNLHFKDPSGRSEFLFCHEADIHFTTVDASLQNEVLQIWESRGFQKVRPAV
jgi:hypothetical protein